MELKVRRNVVASEERNSVTRDVSKRKTQYCIPILALEF